MEGTPKAKARRQSLPSQYHLSSPQAAKDDATAHAELIRFRDEMGIDGGTYFHAHPQQYSQYDQGAPSGSNKLLSTRLNKAERRSANASSELKEEDQDIQFEGPSGSTNVISGPGGEGGTKKKVRKKWTLAETKMLVDGCNKHGVGNWKSMLDDPELEFEPDRTPVDLKDRFRTYFPEAYRHLYPNAKTHLSSSNSNRARRAELPDSPATFEKSRSKKRRPFTKEEDEALREGFEKHGTVWAVIAKNPALASRRSTDLRDRFRNAFPDLYEKAGYKPRPTRPAKNKRLIDEVEAHTLSGGLLKAHSKASHVQREGSEGRSGSENPPTDPSRNRGPSGSPEESHAFEDSGCIMDDDHKGSRMDMDDDQDDEEDFRAIAHPQPNHEGAGLRQGMGQPSSSDSSVVPSRQRSPSNARNQNSNTNADGNANGEYLSPNPDHHIHLRQSPANHAQQHIPLQHHNFGGDASWYPARWLSGTQRYGDEASDPHVNQPHLNNHSQSQLPVLMTDFAGNSNPTGLSSGSLGMLGLMGGNFGLSAGGWSNQQTIIDRYDLPSSSQHFLMHGGEFQSEAAIGDTGSSISGLDEFGTSLSLSSHHRYAGDLFHGRGAGYGGGGWGNFGYLLGGTAQEGMPSFARAAMDLGAPPPPNLTHTPNTLGSNAGMGIPPLDLSSATQSPEHGQVFRTDIPLDSIEELEHVLGNSVLASPSSVDPSKTLLHEVSTPPPGTPTSPPMRSFSGMGPGIGLVRHGSMGTTETLGHGRVHQSSSQQYPQGHHHSSHPHHPPSGGSHSRSFSQPPSEARLPMGMGRSASTNVSSPIKGAFQLENNAYGLGFDGAVNASPQHHQRHFSPAGTPNQALRTLEARNQSPQHHPQTHLQSHAHHHHHQQQQQQQQQQQRTPVQSHASLQAFNSLYPPSGILNQLNNGTGSHWNQISTAAMALDLHGFQTTHGHPHSAGQQQMGSSGLGLVTNGLSMGSGANGYGNAGHFMDQYLDFETNALDLATAVNPPAGGGSFASGLTFSMSSPDLQMPIPNNGASVSSQGQNHVQQNRVQHTNPNQIQQNPSPQRNTFQLSTTSAQPNHSHSHNHNQNASHSQNHNSFGHSTMNMASMDDSMATQQTHHAAHPHPGSGMHRRESFSYGTSGSMQSMANQVFIPLHRVQSAGANSAIASPSISHTSNTSSSTSGSSGSQLKGKGWDKTVTARSAKRSSWGPFKSFNGV